jgi:DNA-binding transcriptional MerR regulator
MNSAAFAQMLGVSDEGLHRLVRGGMLAPSGQDAMGQPRWEQKQFPYARLLLDLLDAGMTPLQLRRLTRAARSRNTAASVALAVDLLIEDALPIMRARLASITRVVEDLERTRASLRKCGNCHRPMEELGCQTCSEMPVSTPRVLDAFFLAADDPAKNG